MPVSGGGFEQCYNAQASVDVETMLVVGQHLCQNPNDKLEIEPALESLNALPEKLGTIDALLADTGYFSQANVEHCLDQEILPYISSRRDKHNLSLKERFSEPDPLPEDADAVTEMKHRLTTKDGRETYAKRNTPSNRSSVSSRPLWASDSFCSAGWSPSAESGIWSAWLGI